MLLAIDPAQKFLQICSLHAPILSSRCSGQYDDLNWDSRSLAGISDEIATVKPPARHQLLIACLHQILNSNALTVRA